MDRVKIISNIDSKLLSETGHELLYPSRQFCKHCGDAMFVKELSSIACKINPPKEIV